MTLYRKLFIGMIAVFILLTLAVFIIELSTTKNHIEQQQRIELNNTLNSLGLALTPYLNENDPVSAESVINAVFDGSHYSLVRLRFLQNDKQILRAYNVESNDSPRWFTRLGLFSAIKDNRIVTSGWRQLAEVEIISDPSVAYDQLWQTLKRLTLVFITVFAVGIAAVAYIVKRSLRPLGSITNKMGDIAKNNFGNPLELPSTSDLVPVVEGINRMSRQLEISFNEQIQEAQRYREQAYIDPVSKLGNRTMFMAQLDHWIEEKTPGGIAILQLSFIADLYHDKEFQLADSRIAEIGQALSQLTTTSYSTLARTSNDEFAFIFSHVDEEEIKQLAAQIVNEKMQSLLQSYGENHADILLGVAHSNTPQTRNEVLALADSALARAKSAPENPFGFVSNASIRHLKGKKQWQLLVQEAVLNKQVIFRYQSAKNLAGKTYHREVFSKIVKDGIDYNAAEYLFALEQLHSTLFYDKHVITCMLGNLANESDKVPYAINISLSTVTEPSFIQWLKETLNKHPSLAPYLHFELPEECFIQHPDLTALLCDVIKSHGAHYGVDFYGRDFQSLQYINNYEPSYVKLDYLYTHNLDQQNHRFTLTSLSRTAHNLGITTIASRVETQNQIDYLADNFVDAFQGFIVDTLLQQTSPTE